MQRVPARALFFSLAVLVVGCTLWLIGVPGSVTAPGVHLSPWLTLAAFATAHLPGAEFEMGAQRHLWSPVGIPLVLGLVFNSPQGFLLARLGGELAPLSRT